MTKTLVELILDRNKALEDKHRPWRTIWQIMGEFVHGFQQDFETRRTDGEILNDDIFDATAKRANKVMSSSLSSQLWPGAAKAIQLEPARGIPKSAENKKYFEEVTNIMADIMDDDQAGLQLAIMQYMRDQGSFGTSAIMQFKDPDSVLRWEAWGVRQIMIDQGPNGFVDTVHYEKEETVRNLVDRYGINGVSEKTRELYKNERYDDKVKILHAIQPRMNVSAKKKKNNKNMPFMSVRLEKENKHILKESGFLEFPGVVGRFDQVIGEIYGRSPGMDALQDILEINEIREATTVAIEKQLDPPLYILDDGRLGGGVIDTSAGALNVLSVSGRLTNSEPIKPIFTVGELNSTREHIQELKQSINDHFNIDRLLDFNNETEMTLGEAQLRDEMRSFSLGATYQRQIETLSRLVRLAFNTLLLEHKLGVISGSPQEREVLERGEEPLIIPDDIAKAMMDGKQVYKIKYTTPASRLMQASLAQGIIKTWQFAAQIKQDPNEKLDADMSIELFSEIAGAPTSIVRTKEQTRKIQDDKAEALQEAQQMQQAEAAAKAVGQLT